MGHEIHSKYRITHTCIQRIHYKLPFALSNKVELFGGLLVYVMPCPRTCGYIIHVAWLWLGYV